MPKTLQIYILSRNRPQYLRESLSSVLNQSNKNIEVIVSDNSDNNEVEEMLNKEFTNVRYIRRFPALDPFTHFSTVLNEACTEYLVMFHDDDVLQYEYADTLLSCLEADSTIAAISCNATILRNNQASWEYFAPNGRGNLRLVTPEDLLNQYFSLSHKGPTPFPGYMYRRALLKGLYLNPNEGGKYSDVSFILKIVSRGPIVWLDKPLMQYRIHEHNDSKQESVGDRLSLLRYVRTSLRLSSENALIEQYRYRYLMNWWREKDQSHQPWRRNLVSRFLITRTFKYNLTRTALWLRLFNKIAQLLKRL